MLDTVLVSINKPEATAIAKDNWPGNNSRELVWVIRMFHMLCHFLQGSQKWTLSVILYCPYYLISLSYCTSVAIKIAKKLNFESHFYRFHGLGGMLQLCSLTSSFAVMDIANSFPKSQTSNKILIWWEWLIFFVLLEKVHFGLYFTASLFWLVILEYRCKEFGR